MTNKKKDYVIEACLRYYNDILTIEIKNQEIPV